MKLRITFLLVILASFMMLLASCEPAVTYSHYNHIGSNGWDRKDTMCFETDTLRRGGTYAFHVALRTTRRFPFQKVALKVERSVYRDKVEIFKKQEQVVCTIATENGDYTGSGVGLLQYECALRALQLQSGDSMSIYVTHFMQDDILTDIRDVGVLVERY